MRFILFYHSLISDWNHGNAHFLRGIAAELMDRGHAVRIYEPEDGWSLQNVIAEHGQKPLEDFRRTFPQLTSRFYHPDELDLDEALQDADVVIVHEWNDPELVRRIGEHRRKSGNYRLLFHDTHHRAVTAPADMGAYDLSAYDGVLAFGETIRQVYLANGWVRRAWTWHEAADTRVFQPVASTETEGDLVWIGNWGDEERTAEYEEFLIGPVRSLGLAASAYGVRYPEAAVGRLNRAGITWHGWLPNAAVPRVFSRFPVTLHIPRRPYTEALPGIPTIRPFEALACGIPLVCAPWSDAEGLFTPGKDFLMAEDGAEMTRHLKRLLSHPDERAALARHGRNTILSRHTCAHRVEELFSILDAL